jgi:DnaJ-domain-containing protein 1
LIAPIFSGQSKLVQIGCTLASPEAKPKQEEEKAPPEPKRQRKQFWWEVLETPEDSDLQAIKKAYRTMIQKYHPDRVSHLGEEFQIIAEEKTKTINGGFEDAKKRKS